MRLIDATLKRCAIYFVWVVLMVSGLVLSTRIFFSNEALPDFARMDPVSASLFILLSGSFLLRYSKYRLQTIRAICLVAVIFVVVISLVLKFSSFTFPMEVAGLGGHSFPPVAAICFLGCSVALLIPNRDYGLFQTIAAATWLLTLFVSLGRTYEVPEFQGSLSFFAMQPPVIACFALMCTALLLIEADRGWIRLFTAEFEGASVAQALVPTAFCCPAFLGYLRLWVSRNYTLSSELGVALLVTTITALFSAAAWYTMFQLDTRDKMRKAGEVKRTQTVFLNAELQSANEKLSSSNDALRALNDQLAVTSATMKEQSDDLIRQQEKKLRLSEQNLEIILANTLEEFLVVDRTGRAIFFNTSFEKLIEESIGDKPARGAYLWEIKPNISPAITRAIFERAIKGESVEIEETVKTKEGDKIFLVKYSPVPVGDEIPYITLVCREITERKQQEQRILNLNKSLSDFQNAIHRSSIVSIADRSGNIVFVNDNFVKISGFQKEELIGQNHRIVNAGYHPKAFWANMWQTISRGNIWRDRVKNRRKTGGYYWVDTFIMPFMDDDGKITQYLSIRNDITAIKDAEEELKQKRILLEEASRISKVGYWVVDKRTGETSVSTEVLSMFGVTAGEFEADNNIIYSRVHPDDLARIPQKSELLDNTFTNEDIDYRILLPDGSIRWVHQRSNYSSRVNEEEKVIGTIQDVSKQKVVEEVLREFNERFEVLSKATNDAIWDWDLDLGVVSWNHGLQTIFGYSEKENHGTGNWWTERLHMDDRHRVASEIQKTFELHQHNWSSTYRYRCADGSFKHVHDRAYILYLDGRPIRMIGAMQDITEQVMAVQEIQKLSLVASKTNNSVMITDGFDRIEWVNAGFERLTGYSLMEVKGLRSGTLLQGPETNPATVKLIKDKIQRRESVSAELINYSKAGHKYWVNLSISPVFDDNGQLKNFISIQTDISELKAYEANITAIARALESLIENANVPIFGTDRNGKINEWNRVCASLTEYSKADLYDKNWIDELVDAPLREQTKNIMADILSGNAISNYEIPVIAKTFKRVTWLLSASPRRNTQNQVDGIIIVAQDISELIAYRKGLEKMVEDRTRELSEALKKEKEVVEMKSKFVSIASHEFRTPLTTISIATGFVRKFKKRLGQPEIDKKLDSIEKQVNHMTAMLDDVLMIGKSEAGKIQVNLSEIRIDDFFKGLIHEVNPSEGRSITPVFNCTVGIIPTDQKLLRNIFLNLFTNALKFSPPGGRVELRVMGDTEVLEVDVMDQGIGISDKDMKNLFTPFFRGDNVNVIPGTGLGLSIVKKAVELLNGSIKVQSKQGEGATFTVTLPLKR